MRATEILRSENAVITGNPQYGTMKIVFKGTYDECITFMRENPFKWTDLVRLDSAGELRGYSSWVL